MEGLFGAGRTAEDFNRFALGRALDTVHDAGSSSIFTGLTLRNLITRGAPLQFAHTTYLLFVLHKFPWSTSPRTLFNVNLFTCILIRANAIQINICLIFWIFTLTIYLIVSKLRQAKRSSFQNSVNILARSLALFRLKA